jgi:aspartokinase
MKRYIIYTLTAMLLSVSVSAQQIVEGTGEVKNLTTNRANGRITIDMDIDISNIEIGSRTIVDIFNAMANAEINVDMISQPVPINSQVSVSFSIPHTRLHDAIAILENVVERRNITIYEDVCKLSIEGIGMEYRHGAAYEFFSALNENDIPVYLVTTSEVKIACCIPKKDTEKAKEVIKERFAIV